MVEGSERPIMDGCGVTIVVCAYNEIGRIEQGLGDLLKTIDGRAEAVEVLVIDNCSTDGTAEWLKGFSHPAVTTVFNERNLGKGGSIKKGIAMSRGEYVVIHDPDLEYLPEDIWSLLALAREEGAAMVLGSRLLRGEARYVYLANYLGVVFLNWVINVLFGCRVTDSATAMKLLEGELARRLQWHSDGFDLDFELVATVARLKGRIAEHPVAYRPRSRKEGKKIRAVRDGLGALRAIVRTRLVPLSFVVPERSASPAPPPTPSTVREGS